VATRDELDIPIPAMAPSYRPTARRGDMMDPATKRLAIFAAIIGAALLGLVAAWAVTSRHRGGVPEVDAPAGPIRVKPADPGGMHVADAGESILSGESNTKQTLAPAPENPAPQGLKAQEQAAADAAAGTPPAEQPPADSAAAPKAAVAARTLTPPGNGGAAGRLAQGGKSAPNEPRARGVGRLATGAVAQAAITPAQAAEETPLSTPPILNTPMPHTAMPETKMPETKLPPATMPETPMPVTKLPDNSFKSTPMPAPDVTLTAPAGDTPAPVLAPVAPAAPTAAAGLATNMAPAAHGKRPVVQFAAVESGSAALAEWHRLVRQYPDLLGDRTPTITKAAHDGKTFWRVRTAGFPSMSDAVVFCQKVKSRGGQCMATF